MYLITTPWWLRKLYSSALFWQMPATGNEVYLTFDDGPHPVITPYVLDLLDHHNAKATFFCIGKNVQLYPEVYQQIIDRGHKTGNHTNNHLNGWKTNDATYVDNILLAGDAIKSRLFRPPYGRISKSQIHNIQSRFDIVMWSVLSGDFDTSISGRKCYSNVVNNAKPGSIIVFHDSEKAFERLKVALPKVLEFFNERGHLLKAIDKVA
jgi:peptidoglycan/xylan/chitin deacetylase (PgdA/CDA1 family)